MIPISIEYCNPILLTFLLVIGFMLVLFQGNKANK